MAIIKEVAKNKNYKIINNNNFFELLPLDQIPNKLKYVSLKKDLCDFDTQRYMIILELTRACNQNCRYCFISEINKKEKLKLKSNSEKNIDKLIDQISKTNYHFTIVFHGGEPLLKKELIKYTIKKINSAGLSTKVRFGLQTSGYNLTDDFVKYAQKNDVNIGVSIDSLSDGLRDPKMGINALEILKQNNLPIGLICIINKSNQDKLFNNFKTLVKKHKIKGILFNCLYHKNSDYLPNLSIVKKEIEKIIDYLLKNNLKISIDPLKMFAERLSGQFSSLCYDGGCGGFKRILAYSVEGKFYPCDSFVDNPAYKQNVFNLSHFLDKRTKILQKATKIRNKLKCNDCKYNFICIGPCVGKLSIYGNKTNLAKFICEYEKLWLELLFKKILNNPVNLKVFKGDFRIKKQNRVESYLVPPADFQITNYLKKGQI